MAESYAGRVKQRVPAQSTLPSQYGPIEIAATARGVVTVALRTTPEAVATVVRRRLQQDGAALEAGDDGTVARRWIDAAREQLREFLDGERRTFDLPLDVSGISDWDRRVLEGVATIGFGHTLGYGQLAQRIGSAGAARAAGGAVSRNPLALVIPCHRVIAGDGTLGGYGGAWPADRDELLELKAALLAREGVHIERSRRAA